MQQNGLIQLETCKTQSLDNGKFCRFVSSQQNTKFVKFILNPVKWIYLEKCLKQYVSALFSALCVFVYFTFRDLNWDSRSKRYAQKSRTFIHISKKQQTPAYYRSKAAIKKGRKDILCSLLFRNRGSISRILSQQVEAEDWLYLFRQPVGSWLFLL